jgi:hypothetical protein
LWRLGIYPASLDQAQIYLTLSIYLALVYTPSRSLNLPSSHLLHLLLLLPLFLLLQTQLKMRSWQALAIFSVLTPVFALDFPTSLNDVHQIVFGGTSELCPRHSMPSVSAEALAGLPVGSNLDETVNPESDPLTFD